jgi:hypothetical protein
VEVTGADTTIQEALRAVERMRQPVIASPPNPKRIAKAETPVNGHDALADDPTLFDNIVEAQADVSTTEPAVDAAGNIAAGTDQARRKRGEGSRKDYNAGIKPVGEIDFVPNAKPSLKAFFAEKAPDSDMDQILVICHYLQHTLQSTQIGPGHILGGFKHVVKPVPKDLRQTIRNMKNNKAWLNFTDLENISLTTESDNRVEHELGKGNGDAKSKE